VLEEREIDAIKERWEFIPKSALDRGAQHLVALLNSAAPGEEAIGQVIIVFMARVEASNLALCADEIAGVHAAIIHAGGRQSHSFKIGG